MTAQAKSPPDDPREGSFRQGDLVSAYRIDRLVGTGGMGWVYRAEHTICGREVAVKVMREDQVALDRAVDRMMREAGILASVGHAGIPRFFECGVLDDGRPWIAMELLAGASLQARLALGEVTPEDVSAWIGDVAEVLAAAHARGVTHRDLKPDNIFLVPDDAAFPVRVIDWGIAHHLSGARFTSMNEAIGTPTYMAPEQARGGPTSGQCDVYGLGVVAYQALAGRPPFSGQSAVEILVQHLNRPAPALAPRCPDAPAALVGLVERMLGKDPDARPTAADVAAQARTAARDPAVPVAILERNRTTATLRAPRPRELDDSQG